MNAPDTKLARIEDKIDQEVSRSVAVSGAGGGMSFSNMGEVMEFAKLMSIAGTAVPDHCRGNPGMCLAVCIQALEWGMTPFAVASKSYVVGNRLSFESQLVHAVIEQRAPLKGRLRHRYEGEGDKRVCIVWGVMEGEAEPFEYRSPEIVKINPKNSPLWKTKPDLQLYYNTSRDWCRVYCPDVLLGIYSSDEMMDAGTLARDVTPNTPIAARVAVATDEEPDNGFSRQHIESEIQSTNTETGEAQVEPQGEGTQAATSEPKPGPQGEQIPAATNSAPPSNADQYAAHCRSFIKAATNADALAARLGSKEETALRKSCGVPDELFQTLKSEATERGKELRKPKEAKNGK